MENINMASYTDSYSSTSSSETPYTTETDRLLEFVPLRPQLDKYGLYAVDVPPTRQAMRKKHRTSSIWYWGFTVRKMGDTEEEIPYWVCRKCWFQAKSINDIKMYSISATSNARRHLINDHGFLRHGSKVIPPGHPESWEDFTGYRQRTLLNAHTAYLKWLVVDGVPFRQASSNSFNALMESLSGGEIEMGVRNHKSVRKKIDLAYKECRRLVSHKISRSLSNVSLSYDIWTSTNDLPFLGIEAHFISGEGIPRQQNILLRLEEIEGAHTGDNIAQLLTKAIQTFEIQARIAFLMSDNAENNSTAVKELGKLLNLTLSGRRLRCSTHIVNLVCQQLSRDHSSNIEASNDNGLDTIRPRRAEGYTDLDSGFPTNTDIEPITKLKAIIGHIKKSPKQEKEFFTIQTDIIEDMTGNEKSIKTDRPLRIVRENATRWNSRYDSVQRAIKLRVAIDQYCERYQHLQGLTVDDWRILEKLIELYEPMKHATWILEGNADHGAKGALWEAYPSLLMIIRALEGFLADLSQNQELQELVRAIQAALVKAKEYRSKMEDIPAYRLALLLHPKYKKAWLDDSEASSHKTAELLRKLRENVSKIQDNDSGAENAQEASQETIPSDRQRVYKAFQAALAPRFEPRNISTPDEVSYYLREAPEETDTPITWWVANRTRFPALYQIALDLFATPSSAADMERIWSACGRLLDTERPRMEGKTLNRLICLQNWFNQGIISDMELERIIYHQASTEAM